MKLSNAQLFGQPKDVSPEEVEQFNAGLLNSTVADEIDIFVEQMQQKEDTLSSGDQQLISTLEQGRDTLNRTTSIGELDDAIEKIGYSIYNINSEFVSSILQKLNKLRAQLSFMFGNKDVKVSSKEIVGMVKKVFAQVDNRSGDSSYQTSPIGNSGAVGETFTTQTQDNKTMVKGEEPPIKPTPVNNNALADCSTKLDDVHGLLWKSRDLLYSCYSHLDETKVTDVQAKVQIINDITKLIKKIEIATQMTADIHTNINRRLMP